MRKQVYLTPRDKELIHKLIDFRGLPSSELIEMYFPDKGYGYERLRTLEDHDYIARQYYYAQRTKDGKTFTQRIASIVYATRKGGLAVSSSIDYRYMKPRENMLDICNLVGKLLVKTPALLSKRQTAEAYNLKNFSPVECSVGSNLIYIIGNNASSREPGRIKTVIESGYTEGSHYVISRTFPQAIEFTQSNYIPWNMAPEILPNIIHNPDHYLNEILDILEPLFPNLLYLSKPQPLIRAQYNNKILHIGELISGSNDLRLILREAPENTIIYVPNRQYLHGVKNIKHNFLIYSIKDQSFFQVTQHNNRLRTTPYELRS